MSSIPKIDKKLKLQRIVMEVFGGCNYTCKMCPQSDPGRGKNFTRKMPLKQFEKVIDDIVPKYGYPVINLEGSGEPTMAKDLDLYIKAIKKRNLKCYMYCNGAKLNGDFLKKILNEKIDFIRFSIIGYDREKYIKWMNIDNFELIISNINEAKEYIKKNGLKTKLGTYHLITDNNNIHKELELYKENVIKRTGVHAYIWKMHNWSGNYSNQNPREKTKRRTCGRPFAPELTVRSGGETNRTGAVVPCCQTLGPPNEAKSILGHLDKQSFEEVYFGKEYKNLREAHENKEFDRIEYCKDCDFLYEDPEVLVWSNDPEARVHHMLGTEETFTLTDYSLKKLS
jgi:radical SAM protein with 4Fe4S-binding SPASM domain